MNSEILPSSRIRDCILKSEKKPFNLFCLGCAVKVPLKTVVYPVLKKINQKLRKTKVSINISSDAFIFETDKKVKIKRCIYPISSFIGKTKLEIANDIRKCNPQSAVILASYMKSATCENVMRSLLSFCKHVEKEKKPFNIGKGHTIQISKIPKQEFILVDYISSNKGDYYGVANNDTIVTIDFNLKHSHWLNVYISLNNALNDLYVFGVYKDIRLYPVYDSIYDLDNKLIRENLEQYISSFKKYNYKIVDFGPIGLNLEAIGSMAIGYSDRELPNIRNLSPGQSLIVTRPIGDLAALVLYIIKQTDGRLTNGIRELKMNVLSKMATPNIEVAKIISDYLPRKGECFDYERHITATKDISGEGISAFEDMAFGSKTDIFIDNLKIHADKSSLLNVPNNTSNTNGAIIMAVHKKLTYKIIRRLNNIGCKAWIAGRVGEKNKNPTIYLEKRLKNRYYFIKNKDKCGQLFSRYKFI